MVRLFFVRLLLISAAACPASAQPNMVLFIADDVSWNDVGCYGHPTIQTPAIDALAASGIRFDQGYLTTSSCSPSRCSIITGRYPHNTGAPELHTSLPDAQIRFPELLRQAGYYTALSGKNHMVGSNDRAFDKISSGKGAGKSEDWVQMVKDRPRDQPFFFWFAAMDAHRKWQIEEGDPIYDPADVVVPPYLIDDAATRQDLADYYHEVSRWDRYIGLVTEEIRQQGELENTMIIIVADNGRPFPRCKTRLYESGIKTPFVVHYPAAIKTAAGATTDSLVSAIDIAATALDVAGLEPAASIQGVSFLPILENPTATTRDVVFAEHNWHVYQAHERMVRHGDYLYIRNNYPERQNLCVEATSFPAGESLVAAHQAGQTTTAQQNIFRKPCPAEELYLVSKDPDNLTNLATAGEHAEALATCRQLLAEWTQTTGDSIPSDPTPDRGESGAKKRNPHREFAGASAGASEINHPGPVKLP